MGIDAFQIGWSYAGFWLKLGIVESAGLQVTEDAPTEMVAQGVGTQLSFAANVAAAGVEFVGMLGEYSADFGVWLWQN